MKTGILLVNLGTPDEPTPQAVKRYLRQFLMDPGVIGLPWLFRWFLVEVLILPRRSHASAHAYGAIWTERGSPLLFHTRDLAREVSQRMGEEFDVRFAMRYGNPAIGETLEAMLTQKLDRIIVMPLYPQYSDAATGSSEIEVRESWERLKVRGKTGETKLEILPEFFDDAGFTGSVAEQAREGLRSFDADHVLFSFHGLPESQVAEARSRGRCYTTQCAETARQVAEHLGVEESKWSVAFQSRLGRAEWIKPYADERIAELARAGVRRLAVISPSFVADCLETLEELGIRGTETFAQAGGERLLLLPAPNASPTWCDAVASRARHHVRSRA